MCWRDVINSYLTSWIRFTDALKINILLRKRHKRATCIIVPIGCGNPRFANGDLLGNILKIYNQSIFKFHLPKILNFEKS